MWALLNDAEDAIEEIISNPKSMTINGITHSRQIFKWTTAELKAVGIVPVTTTGSHLDTNYYIEVDEAFAIAGDKNSVVKTIGVKAADRALEDVDAVDEDGNALLDDYGVQMVTRGLKYNAIQTVKQQQSGYLSRTDWYIIRKADVGTAIPTAIQTFRNAIRADATRIENAITAVTTMDEFIALHTTTYNEDNTVDQIAITQSWTEE